MAVLHRMGYETGIDFYKLLDAADLAEKELMKEVPTIKSVSVVSGLAGVFSGFMKPVIFFMLIICTFSPDINDCTRFQSSGEFSGRGNRSESFGK